MIDSGAEQNLISKNMVDELQIPTMSLSPTVTI